MPRSSSALLPSLKLSTLIICILILSALSFAAAPDRITGPFSAQQLVKLSGGVPLKAQPQYDKGPADPSLKLSYMTLLTVPSASQQKSISRLLAQQQDRRSPLYHKWLTPEQYADRFGLSPNDVKKLTDWLQSQGFGIVNVARGRNFIVFSGTAAQAESAFQTEIHNFDVAGEKHFSNITPPSIPAALSGVVSAVRGLNNFRPKSQAHRFEPDYTFLFQGTPIPFIAPGDVATIYDINALYSAGVDGTGETLAVIGQTGIFQADLTAFRTGFGLSGISCTTDASDIITACNTSNFRYVLVNGVPQNIYGDLPEADIDIEWSGAAARNAQVIFVTATDPNGAGVYDSLYYAIDNNVAPVLTLSYTTPCELAEIGFFGADEVELQKANSFGITFMNSSGDTGAAECDFGSNNATFGYAVAYPASSQYVTGVGGTMIPFSELNSTYWNTSNGSDGGSAKSYIPEQAWNDAQEFGVICTVANPCTLNGVTVTDWASAQSAIGIAADGGGVSNCVTVNSSGKCTSGFPRPTWQAGLIASAVNPGGIGEIQATNPTRYSPDVSLLGSANFPGYIVCTEGSCASGISGMLTACFAGTGPCSIFGGTSVSSPVFAGIVTLLNQYLGSSGGLGNINPTLYSLAATPSNLAFHQVEVGNIGAFCSPGTPSNQPVALQCPSSGPNAGFLGFDASNFDPTTGYNLATGLGSVDANNLAIAWAASLLSATTTTLTSSQSPAFSGVSVTFTATVTTTGANAPTGTVTFNDGTTALGTGTLSTVSGSQVATFATSSLTVGTHSITAVYGGDANNAGSTSSVLSQVIAATTFTFVSTPGTATSHTVLSGQTTLNYSFTATPTSGSTFVNAVNLSCTSFSPADPTLTSSSCAFSSATIAAGSGASTVTMTISSLGPNSGPGSTLRHRSDNRLPWLPLTLPLAGAVMVGFARRKMSRAATVAGMCLMLVFAGFLIACGSSSHPVSVTSVTGSSSSIFPQNTGWTNATATFTAVLANDSGNKGVTWAVSPTLSGQMIQSTDALHATYTPPTIAAGLPSNVTITATAVADTSKTGTASIALNPTTLPLASPGYTVTVTAAEAGATSQTPSVSLVVQ
jgi:Pro-kumamolisin, activation domain/Bacterial Ig-like domain (group 3)